MILLKGLFICENLHNMILKRGAVSGHVHSVFKNACNIESDDLFITLLSNEKKMSPMSVIVDGEEKVDFNYLNITTGSKFELSESEIYCTQKNLFIDMSNAEKWCSFTKLKTSNCSEHELLANIKIMEKCLKTLGKHYGMGALINYISNKLPELELASIYDYAFDRSYEFIKDRFMNFVYAVIRTDMDGIGATAERIIGFGCGLTPAMDDFISGLMVTYIYMAGYYKLNYKEIYDFNNKIISLGLYKTTRVSSEMLRHASLGKTNEAVHNLMSVMLNFNDDNEEKNHKTIIEALAEVIGYGETSGTDTALGIYVALRIFTNLRYRRIWSNESMCRY